MEQHVIDALHQRAKAVVFLTGRQLGGGFDGYWWEDLKYDVYGPNSILFYKERPGEELHVDFASVVPYMISKSIIHEPVQLKSASVDSSSITIENSSDVATIEHTYDVEISESKEFATDVGVDVLVGLTTSLAFGGDIYGTKVETEITTDITTKFNQHSSHTESESRTTSNTVVVPPKTRATVTTMRNIGEFEQRAEYWADLNHGIRLWDSVVDKNLIWSSVGELVRVVEGRGDSSLPLGKEYREMTIGGWDRLADMKDGRIHTAIERLKQPRELYYDATVKFTNATTGSVRLNTEEI